MIGRTRLICSKGDRVKVLSFPPYLAGQLAVWYRWTGWMVEEISL